MVTTGVNRCGISSYIDSSTFLGSTNTSFTSLGFDRIKSETIMLLIHTDLPLPVEPATSKCGVLLISVQTGLPIISFPKVTSSLESFKFLGTVSNTSLTVTIEDTLLGISIPIVDLPGIGASILTSLAAKAKAISLWIDSILLSLVPDLTSISYCVTVGPGFIATTLPLISKSLNTWWSTSTLWLIVSVLSLFFFLVGSFSTFISGKWYPT